ncbi:MAG TPA: hypothetical protein VKB19_12215 [Pedobacter sp.]|nr:hypothetical protein [Pedobacter sp.]
MINGNKTGNEQLQMVVYVKSKGRGNLVLSAAGQVVELPQVLDVLKLVAGLEQLRLAINAGGGTYTEFALNGAMWSEELLCCRCLGGWVYLELLQHRERICFNWKGNVKEFDAAVRWMAGRFVSRKRN